MKFVSFQFGDTSKNYSSYYTNNTVFKNSLKFKISYLNVKILNQNWLFIFPLNVTFSAECNWHWGADTLETAGLASCCASVDQLKKMDLHYSDRFSSWWVRTTLSTPAWVAHLSAGHNTDRKLKGSMPIYLITS